jgi:DNA-directed RNA polymerase beta' subunit
MDTSKNEMNDDDHHDLDGDQKYLIEHMKTLSLLIDQNEIDKFKKTADRTTHIHRVKRVCISRKTGKEIRQSSVVSVRYTLANARPQNTFSTFDLRMGSYNRELCWTCNDGVDTDIGHHGHLDMPTPVVNPLYIKLLKLLTCNKCFFCQRILYKTGCMSSRIDQLRGINPFEPWTYFVNHPDAEYKKRVYDLILAAGIQIPSKEVLEKLNRRNISIASQGVKSFKNRIISIREQCRAQNDFINKHKITKKIYKNPLRVTPAEYELLDTEKKKLQDLISKLETLKTYISLIPVNIIIQRNDVDQICFGIQYDIDRLSIANNNFDELQAKEKLIRGDPEEKLYQDRVQLIEMRRDMLRIYTTRLRAFDELIMLIRDWIVQKDEVYKKKYSATPETKADMQKLDDSMHIYTKYKDKLNIALKAGGIEAMNEFKTQSLRACSLKKSDKNKSVWCSLVKGGCGMYQPEEYVNESVSIQAKFNINTARYYLISSPYIERNMLLSPVWHQRSLRQMLDKDIEFLKLNSESSHPFTISIESIAVPNPRLRGFPMGKHKQFITSQYERLTDLSYQVWDYMRKLEIELTKQRNGAMSPVLLGDIGNIPYPTDQDLRMARKEADIQITYIRTLTDKVQPPRNKVVYLHSNSSAGAATGDSLYTGMIMPWMHNPLYGFGGIGMKKQGGSKEAPTKKISGKDGLMERMTQGHNSNFTGRLVIICDPSISIAEVAIGSAKMRKQTVERYCTEASIESDRDFVNTIQGKRKKLRSTLKRLKCNAFYDDVVSMGQFHDDLDEDFIYGDTFPYVDRTTQPNGLEFSLKEHNVKPYATYLQVGSKYERNVDTDTVINFSRAPALRDLSIGAEYAVAKPEFRNTIATNPCITHKLNQDYDGDMDTDIIPQQTYTQAEAVTKKGISKDVLNTQDGSVATALIQDYVYAIMIMTAYNLRLNYAQVVFLCRQVFGFYNRSTLRPIQAHLANILDQYIPNLQIPNPAGWEWCDKHKNQCPYWLSRQLIEMFIPTQIIYSRGETDPVKLQQDPFTGVNVINGKITGALTGHDIGPGATHSLVKNIALLNEELAIACMDAWCQISRHWVTRWFGFAMGLKSLLMNQTIIDSFQRHLDQRRVVEREEIMHVKSEQAKQLTEFKTYANVFSIGLLDIDRYKLLKQTHVIELSNTVARQSVARSKGWNDKIKDHIQYTMAHDSVNATSFMFALISKSKGNIQAYKEISLCMEQQLVAGRPMGTTLGGNRSLIYSNKEDYTLDAHGWTCYGYLKEMGIEKGIQHYAAARIAWINSTAQVYVAGTLNTAMNKYSETIRTRADGSVYSTHGYMIQQKYGGDSFDPKRIHADVPVTLDQTACNYYKLVQKPVDSIPAQDEAATYLVNEYQYSMYGANFQNEFQKIVMSHILQRTYLIKKYGGNTNNNNTKNLFPMKIQCPVHIENEIKRVTVCNDIDVQAHEKLCRVGLLRKSEIGRVTIAVCSSSNDNNDNNDDNNSNRLITPTDDMAACIVELVDRLCAMIHFTGLNYEKARLKRQRNPASCHLVWLEWYLRQELASKKLLYKHCVIALPQLYTLLWNIFETIQNARMEYGVSVGCIAVQSISEILTQLTLDQFHSLSETNIVTMVGGLPRIQELIALQDNGRDRVIECELLPFEKIPKNTGYPLILHQNSSTQEIHNAFIQTTAIDFIVSCAIIQRDQLVYYTSKDIEFFGNNFELLDIDHHDDIRKTALKGYRLCKECIRCVIDINVLENKRYISFDRLLRRFLQTRHAILYIEGKRFINTHKCVLYISFFITEQLRFNQNDMEDITNITTTSSSSSMNKSVELTAKYQYYYRPGVYLYNLVIAIWSIIIPNTTTQAVSYENGKLRLSYRMNENKNSKTKQKVKPFASRLKQIMTLPFINLKSIKIQNIQASFTTRGIIRARRDYFEALRSAFESIGSIDPRHIWVIAHALTARGLIPMTKNGINMLNNDALYKSTYRAVILRLTEAANQAKPFDITSVSSKGLFGEFGEGGTGSVQVLLDKQKTVEVMNTIKSNGIYQKYKPKNQEKDTDGDANMTYDNLNNAEYSEYREKHNQWRFLSTLVKKYRKT